MDKQAVLSHFSDIIDNMIDESLFFSTYFQRPYYIESAIEGDDDDRAVPFGLNIHFGATRGCIVDEDYDYVVKFDIDGDSYNDAICDRECQIYSAAKARHLEQFFCEGEFLGYYKKTITFYDYDEIERHINWYDYDPQWFDEEFAKNEDDFGELVPITICVPLYGYRKADPHWIHDYREGEDSNTYINMAQKIHSPMRERNLAVAIDFIREYGQEAYVALSDFMYEENINDLHCGNVGDINGKMVFIDYSGYHSSFDDSYREEYSN